MMAICRPLLDVGDVPVRILADRLNRRAVCVQCCMGRAVVVRRIDIDGALRAGRFDRLKIIVPAGSRMIAQKAGGWRVEPASRNTVPITELEVAGFVEARS